MEALPKGCSSSLPAMVQCTMDMSSQGGFAIRSGRHLHLTALLCVVVLSLVGLLGCETTAYSQSVRIVAEPMNVDGLFARIEYLRDGRVINWVHLVDGDGDGVIDGKAGPKADGNWPAGWLWFDDLYRDTVVGETTMSFDGQKVVVTASSTYEFVVGEYEVRAAQ